jgi:hypothetical protein
LAATLTLSVGGSASLAVAGGNATVDGVTASGSASQTLTLIGSVQALAAYLDSGRVLFSGAAGSSTLTIAASAAGAATEQASLGLTVIAPPVFEPVGGPLGAPSLLSFPASFAITPSSSSRLIATGADFGGDASASLSLSLMVQQGALAAAPAPGISVLASSTAQSLNLTGTAQALAAYLAAGEIRYAGPGESLSLRLTAADGALTEASVSLTPVLQDSTTATSGGFAAPASIETLAGALLPLAFVAVAGEAPATLSLAASDGLGFVWEADDSLRSGAAVDAPALAASAGGPTSTVTLSGGAAALNAYLAAGKFKLGADRAGSI